MAEEDMNEADVERVAPTLLFLSVCVPLCTTCRILNVALFRTRAGRIREYAMWVDGSTRNYLK